MIQLISETKTNSMMYVVVKLVIQTEEYSAK